MPIPMPKLDDRRFQDIVDQAKRLIPQYTPEWTDHNVSDPGVTLIELFAMMTDMLLYRVNQIPYKVQLQFLELLGMRLAPPRPAHAPVTFYLSAAQPTVMEIPRETEVATMRTETSDSIVFTTEQDLLIRPAELSGIYSRGAARDADWLTHDLRSLNLSNRPVSIFPLKPAVGDAFYLSFDSDLSRHVIALDFACEEASGAGIDPHNPPFDWQVWQGNLTRWVNCELDYDGTGGFNQSGEMVLHVPTMLRDELQGVQGYWLRCRLNNRQAAEEGSYRDAPKITGVQVESRGATVGARQAITIFNEELGVSNGSAGQRFQLAETPVLARDSELDYLTVTDAHTGETLQWSEVEDFGASGPDDRHYTLDSDGLLQLGPAVLQPDGSIYRFGAVPSHGALLRFSRYQYGGGVQGNLPRGALSVLKSSIPYVARVENRAPASGGLDQQSLEDAVVRAPELLRLHTRAVTADDYAYLAGQIPGVARAFCLAPAEQPGSDNEPRPGNVNILVLPQVDEPAGELSVEQLAPAAELRAQVAAYLMERSLVTVRIDVRAPVYTFVSVQVRLRIAARTTAAEQAELQKRTEAALYAYLNPYTGGPEGNGWPFGRALHISEVYGVLQRLPLVEFVEEVQLIVREPGRTTAGRPVLSRLELAPAAVICSYQHRVTIVS